jgi:hypothetical protein
MVKLLSEARRTENGNERMRGRSDKPSTLAKTDCPDPNARPRQPGLGPLEAARRPAAGGPIAALAGEWVETWGTKGEGDVSYHDVYVLRSEGGRLAITCPGRPAYQFRGITFEDRRLRVQLENNGTVIDYDLLLDAAGKKLEGRAKTNRGANVTIAWDRR